MVVLAPTQLLPPPTLGLHRQPLRAVAMDGRPLKRTEYGFWVSSGWADGGWPSVCALHPSRAAAHAPAPAHPGPSRSSKVDLSGPHNFTLTAMGGRRVSLAVPSLLGPQITDAQF